ncbi:MAG: DsrE family protein [Ferruginibacter sp.]|jgi:intracellular sulfur oxidation DsrE/DsrF family protein|nr:DsrE family protein [Ferruginibacter sp.]
MKKSLFALLFVMNLSTSFAQMGNDLAQKEAIMHKIVFQLSTDDTLAHKALMKQLNNITSVAPDTKIEVVCHGPGLNMLINSKTTVLPKIRELQKRDIQFVACEFSIKERNVDRATIIQEAGFVKAGIIEIVEKQEAGWSYIKSGF